MSVCHLYCFLFVYLAPVVGNFSEEEANGNTVPQDTIEYPLQRDEVHTNNAKGDRNHQIPASKYCYYWTPHAIKEVKDSKLRKDE